MRLLFWNIRAGGGQRIEGIMEQIQAWSPEIVALAEFRGTAPSQLLAAQLKQLGWTHQIDTTLTDNRAANALLLASHFPLTPIDHPTAPSEPARWLLATVQLSCGAPQTTPVHGQLSAVTLGIMHIPNYVTGRKYPYHEAVLATIDSWKYGPGLLVGDTNTGKRLLDEEVPCFNRREHAWMEAIEGRGWCDGFRHFHGETRVYTWYSPNGQNGFRLDEAFANPALIPHMKAARYEWGHNPSVPERRDGLSDHAALIVDFEI